jgi:hypothetical protein
MTDIFIFYVVKKYCPYIPEEYYFEKSIIPPGILSYIIPGPYSKCR